MFCDRQHIVRRDAETGESIIHVVNRETGEVQPQNFQPQPPRPPPPPLQAAPERVSLLKKHMTLNPPSHFYDHPMPRVLFLIITLIFPSAVTIFLICCEIYLHICCHIQNRGKKNEDVFYRSPFHPFTRRFCGACRESESAIRVGLMQEQRRNRYRYLQGIVS